MKKCLLLLACLMGLVKGVEAQTTVVDSFLCDNVWRSYRLYVPASYTPANQSPVVLNMHGLGSNAFEQQYYSNFMPIADTAGFLMVYPQGLSAQGTTYWNVGIPLTPPTNDVKFLSALIDTISRHYTVDRYRVYATGMSMGGYMSHYLALNLGYRIAAIASVTGTIYPGVYSSAAPGRAVPMMQIHGTADSTVPYNGSGLGIAIDTLVRFWVQNDGCNPAPVVTPVPNVNTADGCTATHYVYNGGTNGATCEFYKITGGAHTWPGAPVSIGVTNQDFNASTEIWRFFRQYRLSQFVGISPINERDALVFYPNPCRNELTIKNGSTTAHLTVLDITGKVWRQNSGRSIDMSGLVPGIYWVRYEDGRQAVTEKIIRE